jgi:uncharacterized protein YkwD
MLHRLSALLAATAGTALLAAAAPAVAGAASAPAHCNGADVVPHPASIARARAATLCLLNRERARFRLRPLHENPRLRKAAEGYSRTMVAHSFFDHVSPTGSTLVSRVRATSYLRSAGSWTLGENIAWGSGHFATPRDTVSEWMHSAGHRHNILTARFREIGIGIAVGAPVRAVAGLPAATYTTDFGARG